MTAKKKEKYRYVAIGFMLFAIFFGAGNLIFPASMGQSAGYNVWFASIGFAISGVGLPLLGILAVNYSGCRTITEMLNRMSPKFAVFYATLSYLTVGPMFAIPRVGSVSYEIAIRPLLPEATTTTMAIFLAIFFAVTYWYSISPSKLVDRIGKVLTPALLTLLILLTIKAIVTPMGPLAEPTGEYATPIGAVLKGILEGYNTMDAITSMLLATMVIDCIIESGDTEPEDISRSLKRSGVISIVCLAIVYMFISYIGATSVSQLGMLSTGAPVLAGSAKLLFGDMGAVLLAFVVILACLTTGIGLVAIAAQYFSQLIGHGSYKTYVAVFCICGFGVAMFGVEMIITKAIPVLMFLYPLVISIIIVAFTRSLHHDARCVYMSTIGCTLIGALVIGLQSAQFPLGVIDNFFAAYVPFHSIGLGWISFTAIGLIIGFALKKKDAV